MNYLYTIPVKCDSCGEMTIHFLDRTRWWGKYLKVDERKICRRCISERAGYAEEFKERFGIDLKDFLNANKS